MVKHRANVLFTYLRAMMLSAVIKKTLLLKKIIDHHTVTKSDSTRENRSSQVKLAISLFESKMGLLRV
jgi:hypothetical protein